MALIKEVFRLCQVLSKHGWRELLRDGHGLDIGLRSPTALAEELDRSDLTVDRTVIGFEDFAGDATRGIEPGLPARSLLYHALASPNVLNNLDGRRLDYFPTLRDLDIVENYAFAKAERTVESLLTLTGAERMAVVVFAYEYRPAPQTCHKRHADMVYSRTGVARVGTADALYQPELRGFLSRSDDKPFALRVSPSRFAAYLSVQVSGRADEFRPMRFRDKSSRTAEDPPGWVSDDKRLFWVPVHKLFSGSECLTGTQLKVTFKPHHCNEKLLRVERQLKTRKPAAPPYRRTTHIAELSKEPEYGVGTLMPEPHEFLVEEAKRGRTLATFLVPKGANAINNFDTLRLPTKPPNNGKDVEFRSSPEYVHIRTLVKGKKQFNLNELDDQALNHQLSRPFRALHYIDFTGDGWMDVKIAGRGWAKHRAVVSRTISAYSLVTAPDFFPSCDQRELSEWSQSPAVPASLRDQIWNIRPDCLADQRLAPNVQLEGNPFESDDFTMTALVPPWGSIAQGPIPQTPVALRHAHLPDDAAGVFAPGWDVSRDWVQLKPHGKVIWHLAAYGLGSPFPEDAKLCAALSTFWPTVAPDATREMEPIEGNQSGTVAPLTDQEIGQLGDLPWDGVHGPRIVTDGAKRFVEYRSFRHVDYVRNALEGKLTSRLTGRIDAEVYQNRILALAYAYRVLGALRTGNKKSGVPLDGTKGERQFWKLLSFQRTLQGTPELEKAQMDAETYLPGNVYRSVFFPVAVKNGKPTDGPVGPGSDFRTKRIPLTELYFLFVDPENRLVLVRPEKQPKWKKGLLIV